MSPAKKGVRFTVLVEDKAFWRLVRGALIALGFEKQKIRLIPLNVGKGSAEQWVREQYPNEVKAQRSRNYQNNLALIVGTDADKLSVKKRKQMLSESLVKAELDERSTDESILIWIPRRNIETWLKYLDGDDVDEETDYKHKVSKPNYKLLGTEFVTRYRKFINEEFSESLPSLQSAFDETKQRMP